MDGKILKKKLQSLDIQMNEIAKRLNISPQNLQNRFKSKEITLDFLIEVSKAVNVSVYYFIKDTIYENEFLQPDNLIVKEPDSEFLPNKNNVVDAKNQTIEILQREVQDLRNDKDFLKNIINSNLVKRNPETDSQQA
ncbi:transcriptional regulator with XRE-family HTH domain [Flavobacterium sp. 28YEA47A]|uniref:helix-turn-helix domain-containing protein n=1 Tax=Flavobacterium sp. 28YEA47A TaxID=3156276 RepID=UPI00351797CB